MLKRYIPMKNIPQESLFELTPSPLRYIPSEYIEGADMEARQQRGLEIAATSDVIRKGGTWLVPSQSGKGKYTVALDPNDPYCSCPDHQDGGHKCKHIF